MEKIVDNKVITETSEAAGAKVGQLAHEGARVVGNVVKITAKGTAAATGGFFRGIVAGWKQA